MRNLFVGPNKIDDIASAMQKLERGDLKLRVRALEAERALTRVQVRWGERLRVSVQCMRTCVLLSAAPHILATAPPLPPTLVTLLDWAFAVR